NEPKRSSPMRTDQPSLVGSIRKIVVIACLATIGRSTTPGLVPNFIGHVHYERTWSGRVRRYPLRQSSWLSTFLRHPVIFTLMLVGAALAFIGYGPPDPEYDGLGAAAPWQVRLIEKRRDRRYVLERNADRLFQYRVGLRRQDVLPLVLRNP